MAVKATRVTVTTSATMLTTGDTGHLAGSGVAIRNMSTTVTVLLGGPDVTVANGYPLAPESEIALDLENSIDLPHAIVAAGTAEVAVLRVGV